VFAVIDLRRVYHTLAIRQKLASWLRGYRYPTSGAVLGSFKKKKQIIIIIIQTKRMQGGRKREREIED
jgi:hypothetical protein